MVGVSGRMRMCSVVVLVLAHQGYWFGGQANELRVAWPITADVPEAVLHWKLMFANTRIVEGAAPMPKDGEARTLQVELPPARVRTEMTLRWRLIATAEQPEAGDAQGGADEGSKQGKVLAEGERPLHVFPDNLLASAAVRYQRHAEGPAGRARRLTVVDPAGALHATLKQAQVPHEHVESIDALGMQPPDVLLLAPDALGAHDRPALRTLANGGARVMVFAQQRRAELAGFDLTRRAAPPQLTWRAEHPLLARFRADDLQTWTVGGTDADSSTWRAVSVPADEPALAVAHWPFEVETDKPALRDAAVVSQTVGEGRIVLWQVPLGDWRSDPRSQKLLAVALDYLPTAPQPTPPLGQRVKEKQKDDVRSDQPALRFSN